MTRPLRRITLHLSQIFFTLGLTFMTALLLLITVNDATSCEVIRTQLHDDTVSRQDTNVVLSHLPTDMSEDLVPVS